MSGAYLPTKVQLSKFPVLPNGIMTYTLPAVFMRADGFLVKIIGNSTQCFFKKIKIYLF